MKKAIIITTIILIVMVESSGQRQAGNIDFIKVDVTKSYSPSKELILQDFMDVEYIALETNDIFINQGVVQDVGEKFILVKNHNQDGDIFVYDRTGKAIRKINRKGQGGEEYIYVSGITLDEENGEMFVNDFGKIVVYDLDGKFKRSIKLTDARGSYFFSDMFSYDKNNLICYDKTNVNVPFFLVSKQDGSITQQIKIPFKEKKVSNVNSKDESGNPIGLFPGTGRSIVPYKDHWLLAELSSDTIYTFLPDYSLTPFIVRTPSVQSMNPEVFLFLRIINDRYYFMETVKKTFDFKKSEGFPRTFMMYDTQEKAILGYKVYNGDYSSKKEIYMSVARPVNHKIDSWQPLEAFQLVEDYKKGILKGKLKDIAAKLDEDDNPVIMLIKHKK